MSSEPRSLESHFAETGSTESRSAGSGAARGGPAVVAREVSKSYVISHNAPQHTTAAEALLSAARRPWQRQEKETFWALRDISFEIGRGEVVGIIGPNGSGKSTLLKILSNITEPTTGSIDLYGRVGSLLEVGTGFHPELTGRENIYLNGAILGMRHREIDAQFDAIVDFAGIERFLDTPVKRYSSGMYVRLAFAVAAHLRSEILLIDEVLAVGDAVFQQKCLGKMGDIAEEEGRTVLFVSHNMAGVQRLCPRALVLRDGVLIFDGDSAIATQHYLGAVNQGAGAQSTPGVFDLSQRTNSYLAKRPLIQSLTILDEDQNPTTALKLGSGLTVVLNVEGAAELTYGVVIVRIKTSDNLVLATLSTNRGTPPTVMGARAALETFRLHVPSLPFIPGSYWLEVILKQRGTDILDALDQAASFQIVEAGVFDPSAFARNGLVLLESQWNISPATPFAVEDSVDGSVKD